MAGLRNPVDDETVCSYCIYRLLLIEGQPPLAIILGFGYLLFHVPIKGGLWNLFGITLLFIDASLSLGLVISTIAKSQLQAMQMTVFVLMHPSSFRAFYVSV